MTRRPPGPPTAGDGGGEFARVEALAGLAREVDGLRRGLEVLVGTPTRVDDLARTVAQLADALAATPARPGPMVAPSWLTAPGDGEALTGLLEELCRWLHTVFLRYPDGAAVLPECWLWHPEVIEELLWLSHAWRAAYDDRGASVQLAGDWHDRQRPGVVRRLKTTVGSCSRERHQTRPGWNTTPTGAIPVPGVDAAPAIARWWADARDQPPPEPASENPESSRNAAGRDGSGISAAVNGDRKGWSR
ncbi:hypothetical protein Acsp06_54170 [Actinomycetospora sp. NBRC 106375]|uniref:hypothetical protein n=1 Tax=Actinomycetospora sp. NBRC 106375 TaxID=3032207 RepID=UPI0024A1E44B|nr:hypothetical protein [Actinomycetospora sp. NBRC 106375]GLZ49232.1 hypothetical protein Acsp06_54170 [Actinomycetospora sp. NBRC 106375]